MTGISDTLLLVCSELLAAALVLVSSLLGGSRQQVTLNSGWFPVRFPGKACQPVGPVAVPVAFQPLADQNLFHLPVTQWLSLARDTPVKLDPSPIRATRQVLLGPFPGLQARTWHVHGTWWWLAGPGELHTVQPQKVKLSPLPPH